MGTPLSDAWSSLQSGRLEEAREGFREAVQTNSGSADAYLGLATAGLASGDLRGALSFGQQSLEQERTPDAQLLLGEVHSRMGNRRKATQHLQNYFSDGGDSPYAHALLGEQMIRTARWEEGLDEYITGLSEDDDRLAFRQVQGVLSDLTDVVSKGRLPAKPAEKFIDQLERQWASPTADSEQFFNSVRRAIDQGQTLTNPNTEEPLLEVVGQRKLPGNGSSNVSGGLNTSVDTTMSAAEPSDSSGSDNEKGIDPKQKDLAGVIKEDRRKNEQLQDAIGSMPPPDWPSSPNNEPLDPIPRMDYENQSIFADAPGMDATDFRITTGNMRSEIFLERCLQNLLTGATEDRAVAIRFRPEAITRMEINCWDGLLDRVPAMSPIYAGFYEDGDNNLLAVGRFIGDCVAARYDGTWDFANPPDQSKLIVGNTELDPMGLAKRWSRESDPDAVSLDQLTTQAAEASRQSTSLDVERNHIDPTRELEGQSLGVKLAELWGSYLFRLADASFADLAETIEPLDVQPSIIVFSIASQYCPELASGPGGAALLEGGTVPVAYFRNTGEFLLLASKKHAARGVEARFEELNGQTAGEIAQFLAQYHRPGWQFAGDETTASELSELAGTKLEPPQFVTGNTGRALTIDALADQEPIRLTITSSTQAKEPWHLQMERLGG